MTRGDEKRLDDIRDMCVVVAELVGRGRETLDRDSTLWLALERTIEIAGEAATQLTDETKARYPTVAWRELIAVRVLLAHAYHRVDRDQLWSIGKMDFPVIAEALTNTD